MTKINNKKNLKTYMYVIGALLAIVLLVVYVINWVKVQNEEEYMNSYLIKTGTVTNEVSDIDSLKALMNESPSSYFIYMGYLNNEEVYNYEKNIKRVIDKYKINDIFYYFDVTSLKENNQYYLNDINEELSTNIKNVPVILYVKDGKIEPNNILNNKSNSNDLEILLKANGYEEIN